jgi:hypothetical protein
LDEFIFKRFFKTGHKLFFQLLFATIIFLPWTGVVFDLPLFSIEDKIVDPETGAELPPLEIGKLRVRKKRNPRNIDIFTALSSN